MSDASIAAVARRLVAEAMASARAGEAGPRLLEIIADSLIYEVQREGARVLCPKFPGYYGAPCPGPCPPDASETGCFVPKRDSEKVTP